MRTIVDDFLDGLVNYARDFAEERIEELAGKQHQRAPRARRVSTKPPKVKKPKAERVTKPTPRVFQQTHYETLEVIQGASPDTISAAYRSLCQRNHPDKYPNDARARKHGEERTKAFTEAYAVLKDPAKRREYDAKLKREAR
jgi:DnaJ-domain-containing protein 1